MQPVRIAYFSDLLCIWAYIAQQRVDELKRRFAEDIRLENRFCSVFGDSGAKIGGGWAERGGYEGYSRHLEAIAAQFPEVELDPAVWTRVRPASSVGGHAFLKAVEIVDVARFDEVAWALRRAFFCECRNIAEWQVQCDVATALGIDLAAVTEVMRSGEAFARLATDYQEAERLHILGSPSFVLNEGRQKLYGNVGYRVLEANVRELLRSPMAGEASWC